ncbi:hypothetical protein M0D21_09880 [Aquimarina sp. D1M17]|uniref:hypothetical protein n=1 Tax=Aquimarina acroporae TaxID=2937283 RepID=UPI0020BF388B|nr:hypothetical protein [Aquimarina acroporae]MCK8521876.1 hypothetical protein [Aquimarina acroporae]
MIAKILKYPIYFFLFSFLIACSGDDDPVNDETGGDPNPDPTPTPDTNPNNGGCDNATTAVFIEKDGLLTVESENGNFSGSSWKLTQDIADSSGEGYLIWDGDDAFNKPGNGLLTYKIRIANPGTYRFIWRSYIGIGTNGTEHNDSWLRIPDAKHFYGKKGNGNIVYPNDTTLDPIAESAGQQNTSPNGSSKEGWFKIYMNKASTWHWQSSTSDNDAHDIFVVFDTPGDYTIEISGRSKGHAIDKFVLFTETTTQNDATKDDNVKSEIKCE